MLAWNNNGLKNDDDDDDVKYYWLKSQVTTYENTTLGIGLAKGTSIVRSDLIRMDNAEQPSKTRLCVCTLCVVPFCV